MKAHHLFLAILALFLIILTTAKAQVSAPESIVFEVESVWFTEPPGTFQANASLTFTLSQYDPDQTNGAFQYTYYLYNPDPAFAPTRWVRLNFSDSPVTYRTGWVKHQSLSFSGMPIQGYLNNISFNMTAWNSGTESGPSCMINVTDLRIVGTHVECGHRLDAPSGIGVVGVRAAQVADDPEGPISIPALTDSRWHFSPDDPNSTVSNLTYYLHVGADINTMQNYTGMIPNWRSNGVFNYTVETFTSQANARFPFYAKVQARDNFTRQVSNFSCTAYVSGGSIRESGACGTFLTDLTTGVGNEAHFPFLNLTDTAERMGTDTDFIGPILGAMVVLGLASMGFVAGGMVIGTALLLVGIPFIVTMGLMPYWVVILIFLGMLSVVVLSFAKGGSSE